MSAHDASNAQIDTSALRSAIFFRSGLLVFHALFLRSDLFRRKCRDMVEAVNPAVFLSANGREGSSAFTESDDCLAGMFALLRLAVLGLVFLDAVVCVPGQYSGVILSAPVRCDLYQFGTGGNGALYMRLDFAVVAGGQQTLCGIWANCKSFLLAPRRRTVSVGKTGEIYFNC